MAFASIPARIERSEEADDEEEEEEEDEEEGLKALLLEEEIGAGEGGLGEKEEEEDEDGKGGEGNERTESGFEEMGVAEAEVEVEERLDDTGESVITTGILVPFFPVGAVVAAASLLLFSFLLRVIFFID